MVFIFSLISAILDMYMTIFKNSDIMLDLETLATQPNAAILSIAAVRFDAFEDYEAKKIPLENLETFHVLVDIDQQNRYIDANTLDWWGRQDQSIIDRVFASENRLPLNTALDQLRKFVAQSRRIWCQGTDFDVSILADAYRQINSSLPWEYWRSRDSRTIMDLVNIELPKATHDALEDCLRQIVGVQKALKHFNCTSYVR